MGARIYNLMRQIQVIVQRVELFARICEVTGVAHRHLSNLIGLAYCINRRTHLIHVVQGVENTENIDTTIGCFLHECFGHLVRVRGVSHRIAATQQHLDTNVRHRFAQLVQAHPRIFLQKAQRHIVGGSAPGLHTQQLWGLVRNVLSGRNQIVRTHTSSQQ